MKYLKAMLRYCGLIIAFGFTVFCSSCQTVPYTGRSQVMMISEDEESHMGEQAWQEVKNQYKKSSNSKHNSALERVGPAIARVADQPNFRWEFMVFESKEPNAFCLPGGKVAVFTGLFEFLANDAELATVVGHEVAHAIARHGAERYSHAMLQQTGGQILQTALGGTRASERGTQLWLLAYAGLSNVGVMLPYSRTQEYEADQIGLMLMAKAGYDPNASLDFWSKFSTISSNSRLKEFFSTHPMSKKRMEEMRKLLPDVMEEYNACPSKKGYGTKLN